MIDLRSDTVTQPTQAMRQAMANAEVGDDVFGDDPTVNALERRTAEVLGKEAAVYMPTGSMTNQVAIRAHTEAGDELILDGESHTYYYEAGGPAALSGAMCRLLNGERGIFTAAQLKAAFRPRNVHVPPTKLVLIENTHNRGGGSIWPMDQLVEVTAVAHDAGLKTHLDGARLWNASAATGIAERDYAQHFDSISVCFSKGLGAPVGSVLASTAEFIARARRFRKQFGGAMRQAGIIAAGALHALEHHRARLKEDHANAKILAEGLATIPGVELVGGPPQTNIVAFRIPALLPDVAIPRLKAAGLMVTPRSADSMRMVTHLDVTTEQIRQAVQIVRGVASAC